MDCSICEKHAGPNKQLICIACARASFYAYRVDLAKTLLSKESADKQVASILQAKDKLDSVQRNTRSIKGQRQRKDAEHRNPSLLRLGHQPRRQAVTAVREHVEDIARKGESLKARIHEYKSEIALKKASLEARREALSINGTAHITTAQANLETQKQAAKAAFYEAERLYSTKIVSTRKEKLKEAASLAGLQQQRQQKPEASDGRTKSSHHRYYVHGIPILDLRDVNNADPNLVTESLTHIARLLVLACYYLQIRLPAEIVLPHAGYPFGTVFAPTSSYIPTRMPHRFVNPYLHPPPGTGPPAYSHAELLRLGGARARPLFVCHRLTDLAREDSMGYSLFVEGAALLAWNVAWACRIQGIPVAEKEWLDICAIGRNMYQLLILTPRAHLGLSRRHTSQQTDVTKDQDQKSDLAITFGTFSHASASHFLHAGANAKPGELNSPVENATWKFASHIYVKDKIKSFLQAEMSGAEWEVLGSDEYHDAVAELDDTGDTAKHVQAPANVLAKTNGWTKVKERPAP